MTEIAKSITAEDAQLFYQVALNGKRDIGLAPDPRSGFEMILLRMLAFRPAAVIDDSLGPDDLQAVAAPPQGAAGEGGSPVKKPREAPAATELSAADRQQADQSEPTSAGASRAAAVSAPPAPSTQPTAEQPASAQAITVAADVPTAGAMALSELTPATWSDLLERLGLVGIVYNVASHCELRERDDNTLQFLLDAANASLFNDSHRDKIRLALENYFGSSLSVAIEPGEVRSETPAMRKARLTRERQQEAIAAIEGDPQLQRLICRFDGELDRSSIAPTDL